MKLIPNYFSKLIFSCLTIVAISFVASNPSLNAQPCVDTYPYFEDFDSGAGGWTSSIAGITGWSLGTPNKSVINSAASGSNSWVTGGLTTTYAANNNSWVESPCFDFTGLVKPAIALSLWWESEFSWDGATLVSSIDNGLSWQAVGGYLDPVNWFTDSTINGGQFGGPCGQGLGWTGLISSNTGSGGWVTAQHALTGLGGQSNVLFRFCFASDFSNQYDGFAFDDIAITELPDVQLGPDTVMCFNDTLILDACLPTATTYFWNTTASDTFCTLSVTNANFYVITVVDTLGFIAKDTIQVDFSSTNVQLPPNQLVCPGDTFTVNAMNPWATFQWFPGGSTDQSLKLYNPGTYTVIATDTFGCVSIDSIGLTVDFVPDVDLGPDTTVCIGDSYLLDAGNLNPGSTYLWNFGGATSQTIVVTAPGTYIVELTTPAQCSTTDTMNLTVQLSPVVDLGPDRIECDSFSLNANNPGANYQWSTNEITQSINSNIPGNYWVTVTNVFGCANADSVTITAGQIPVADLGPDLVICNGQPATINSGSTGNQYLWSTSAMTASISVGLPGQYSIIVSNTDNCFAYDTVNVALSPLVVDLGPDITICDGDSTLLNAGNTGMAYTWSTGQSTPTIHITTGGTYTVAVVDTAGCNANDLIIVTAQQNFTSAFSTAPDTAILNQVAQFNDQSTGNPTSWFWEFGDGLTSTQQNPSHTYQSLDTFNVCLTVSDGICTNTICEEYIVDLPAGIEDDLGLDLSVYPNPNSGQFQVDFSLLTFEEIKIEIFDVSGRAIMGKDIGRVNAHRESINISEYPRGLYLMKLTVNETPIYRKVMVN